MVSLTMASSGRSRPKHATPLTVAALRAQRRQANAGRLEAALDRERLPGDVACAIAAQEEDCFGELLLQAVAVERNGVVISGADLRRMDRLRHGGIDRTWRDGIDPDAKRREFDRLLLGQVRKGGFARTVGGAQRRSAQSRYGGDVDDGAPAAVAHQRNGRLRAQERSGK